MTDEHVDAILKFAAELREHARSEGYARGLDAPATLTACVHVVGTLLGEWLDLAIGEAQLLGGRAAPGLLFDEWLQTVGAALLRSGFDEVIARREARKVFGRRG